MDFNGEIQIILEKNLFGNTVADYLLALAVFGLALFVFKVFREMVLTRLKTLAEKTETDLDETLIDIIRSLRPPFYLFISFYISLLFVDMHEVVFKGVTYILIIWVGYQVGIVFSALIDYVIRKKTAAEKEAHTQAAAHLLGTIVKVVAWIVVIIFVLSNMGVNVNSLMGALGIGGLAVALAVQNILNDLFSSFSIYFDKPFEVGDFIMVGEHMGIVEYIGVKTTRIRALQGEEIVLSNQELTTARIQNFKKLKERRVAFRFGVTYETSNEVLKKIPGKVKKIIEEAEMARFDRAHFYRFDDSALTFEVVYFLLSAEYVDYMDTQQEINLKIKAMVEKEGAGFAYPTRTVHVHSN